MDLLANGWTVEKTLDDYPQLKREDITTVLKYAAEIINEEKVIHYLKFSDKKISS